MNCSIHISTLTISHWNLDITDGVIEFENKHLTVDFGPGTSPPMLRDVQCTGSESSLGQCTSQPVENQTCYAAGVMCAGMAYIAVQSL